MQNHTYTAHDAFMRPKMSFAILTAIYLMIAFEVIVVSQPHPSRLVVTAIVSCVLGSVIGVSMSKCCEEHANYRMINTKQPCEQCYQTTLDDEGLEGRCQLSREVLA